MIFFIAMFLISAGGMCLFGKSPFLDGNDSGIYAGLANSVHHLTYVMTDVLGYCLITIGALMFLSPLFSLLKNNKRAYTRRACGCKSFMGKPSRVTRESNPTRPSSASIRREALQTNCSDDGISTLLATHVLFNNATNSYPASFDAGDTCNCNDCSGDGGCGGGGGD